MRATVVAGSVPTGLAMLFAVMQGEAGRRGGTPNSIIRIDWLPLIEKHCGVGDRGQSSMLVILGWSIVLECIG